MPKLILVNPGIRQYRLARQGFRVQPLNLAYLAALTPPSWDIRIVDENIAPAEVRSGADLVGITTLTATVNRAYELAAAWRRLRIPVVLGGIHVSMMPDEAEEAADAVVIGEAESVWPQVLEDAAAGRLKKRYAGEHIEFQRAVHPRRDLLSPEYAIASIQTSRGCPFNCEFCSVKAFNGSRFRQRDVDDVLDELATIPQRLVFFTDDNLVGYSPASRQRVKALFRGMIARKLNKRWMCQISVNFADDPETVDLAAASGCILVLAGIESVDDRVLQGAMNKRINSVKGSAYYREFIAALHRRGIVVLGTMVFGNDEESPDVFDVTARFYRESGLDVPWPGLLTPYPGTALFARLKAESRLLFTDFPADWSKYNQTLVVAPKSGQRDEFLNRLQAFVARNFGLGSVLTRAWRTWRYSRSVLRALLVYNLNRSLARRLRKSIAFIPAPQPRTGC